MYFPFMVLASSPEGVMTFLPGEDRGDARYLLASRYAKGKNPVAYFICPLVTQANEKPL